MFLAIDNVPITDIAIQKRLESLTEAQATSIALSLDDGWWIDRIVSCDETLALLLTPPGGIETNTAFYVDADEGGLNFSVMQNDNFRLRGCYGNSVDALLSAIYAAC